MRTGPNPIWLVSLEEEETRQGQREVHVKTWGEGGHGQAKQRGLRRIQFGQHLDLGHLVFRIARK